MEYRPANMMYAVMRSVRSDAQGYMRAESLAEGTRVTLRAEGMPENASLRLLLLSCGEEGAVLDLGAGVSSDEGMVSLCRVVPPVEMQLWDAAVLAEDWPSGQLAAAAWLTASAGPVWRLAEAAKWYLTVPAKDYCLT